jgi:hypothetical protein
MYNCKGKEQITETPNEVPRGIGQKINSDGRVTKTVSQLTQNS